jgi:hypothetical protein
MFSRPKPRSSSKALVGRMWRNRRVQWRRRGCEPYLLAIVFLVAASDLAAQEDSVTVQAGARYAAGGMTRFLLGSEYRDLWAASIRVPVLRPDTFAGGLRVLQRGQGLQTASLRLEAVDGRQFVFRSVDKNQSGGLHEDLQGTWVSAVVQDQVHSKHPGAALVVAPLLAAAGVLHADPRLAVMADHPVLGEFRSEFAGMLGMIEERPDDAGAGPGFAGFRRIIGTERLLERLDASPDDRVDARAYLTARLLDLLVGDWDRHADQWRWGEREWEDGRIWVPIPRDRDNAFSHVDGLIGAVAGAVRPAVVRFGPTYDVFALTYNAQALDRRILAELPLAVWDSLALAARRLVTEEVIAGAVERLPPPYREASGARLMDHLTARRDGLPEAAREFYFLLAREVDVYGTDENERASIEHLGDSLRVRLHPLGSDRTFFDRTFHPAETREVRVHLRGGDDRAMVGGAGTGRITVRVLGGAGDDELVDATVSGRRGRVVFHDAEGRNIFHAAAATRIDRRPYAARAAGSLVDHNAPPPRDHGVEISRFAPSAGWYSGVGPVVGGGPTWTRFGFRRLPYATRSRVAVHTAPLHLRFGVAADRHVVRTGGGGETTLEARATQVSMTRYHGRGNDTPAGPDPNLYRVWASEIVASARMIEHPLPRVRVSFGPVLSYTRPEPVEGSPADLERAPGGAPYGLGGIRVDADRDGRDDVAYPRRGLRLLGSASAHPVAWGADVSPFGRVAVGGATYVALPLLPLDPVLALRAGGERVWGAAPLQHLAFIGGSSTVRGFRYQRFAGEASLHGAVELRSTLGRANLLLARGDLGTLVLADAGRVFVSHATASGWHRGVGGGFWFATLGGAVTGHLLLARGETLHLSAGLGLPF